MEEPQPLEPQAVLFLALLRFSYITAAFSAPWSTLDSN